MKKKLSIMLLILSIASLGGTITTMVLYFINNSKVNGIEFIEVAARSVKEAKELMDYTSTLGWMTIILAIVTLLLIAATTVLFILRGKEKKMKLISGEEKTNESN